MRGMKLNHVGGFHDWYLIRITSISDYIDPNVDVKVQLKFTSQAAFDCLLEFEGSTYIKYCLGSCNRIYLSSIVMDDKYKYCVDGEEELDINDIAHYSYFRGKKMRWKFVLKEENDW